MPNHNATETIFSFHLKKNPINQDPIYVGAENGIYDTHQAIKFTPIHEQSLATCATLDSQFQASNPAVVTQTAYQ
jgi:hypothetical protein